MPRRIHKLTHKEEINFVLIGIASAENDYRLSWTLNNEFGLQLNKVGDLEIFHKRLEEKQQFSQFQYHDEKSLLLYRLISNRCENGYLMEDMVKFDYLLQIFGDVDRRSLEELSRKINKLDGITLAFTIDPASLKSVQKLLL